MNFGGAATGIGSLPGKDIVSAVAETFGELPDFPYLPELPARGPGSDMIGRTAALLVDLPIELYSGRWRVAAHSGLDLRRAHDLLERDLDTLAEKTEGYRGPLKIQAAGPWTMAATVELALGAAFLADHGATRDLAASLAEGLRSHVAQVRSRVPGAEVVLQIDEPALPSVLAGRVPTASGLHTYRSVSASRARDTLASIVDVSGAPVIMHCCAADAPIALMREAGATGLALDMALVKDYDPLGEAIDAGLILLAGMVPARSAASAAVGAAGAGHAVAASTRSAASRGSAGGASPSGPNGPGGSGGSSLRGDRDGGGRGGWQSGGRQSGGWESGWESGGRQSGSRGGGNGEPDDAAEGAAEAASTVAARARRFWRDLGFPAETLAQQVVLTPSCGLAGATPAYARAALKACRDAARQLAE